VLYSTYVKISNNIILTEVYIISGNFMDSRYDPCWLKKSDADALLNELAEIGNKIR